MSGFAYSQCEQFVELQIEACSPVVDREIFIRDIANRGGFAEYADLISPLPTPAVAQPSTPMGERFMLFCLSDRVRAGEQLSPECHVVYEGWDGTVEVSALLSEALDRRNWDPNPTITAFYDSNRDCLLRIDHPSIRLDHAILCHWDGQFRILPIQDALVVCDGQPIHPGRVGTVKPRTTLQLGDLQLKFDDPVQFGLE